MSMSILDTRNYNECMKYVETLDHFYHGAKLSPVKCERIKNTLEKFCKERKYKNDEEFPLIIFSARL